MNRVAKWMMRLYPARWRRRYGDELDALLAESGADTRVVVDLLKGGVRMQFSTWSFAKLAAVLGVAGVLLAAAGSYLIAPIYESKATVEMTGPQPGSVIRRMEPVILSRPSLASIINAPQLDLYISERKVTPLEDVIEKMRNDIHTDFIDRPSEQGKSAVFRIGFQYPDPAKAREVTAMLAQKFADESFQPGLRETAGKHGLYWVDPANLAIRPAFPDERVVLIVGFLLGVSIPFAWRGLRRKSIASWGFAALVVVFGFAGVLAANIAFVLCAQGEQNPLGLRYRSTATMFVQNGSPAQIQAMATDATSRTTLSTIIHDPHLNLYKEERKTQPLEDVIQNMQRNLAVTPSGQYFNISFEYPDRYKTQQTVNFVMIRLDDAYKQTYGGLPDESVQPAPTTLKVVDGPSMPVLPISPYRYVIATQGGLAGLLAAAVIATIRRRWRPEADLPVDVVNG
jgi:hypothetical protein